jgi:hypothetical protein
MWRWLSLLVRRRLRTPPTRSMRPSLRKLVDFQIGDGTSGLLVVGGSGEFVSLTPAERERVGEVAIDQTAKRIPILVDAQDPGGTGDGPPCREGRGGRCFCAAELLHQR